MLHPQQPIPSSVPSSDNRGSATGPYAMPKECRVIGMLLPPKKHFFLPLHAV